MFLAPASGARIYVTTTAQKIGGIGTGGCSLQEAIYSSVLHQSLDGGAHGIAIVGTDPDDFITTECVQGTGNGDTIVLPTGATFNVSEDINTDAHNPYGLTATPIIFSTMTIEGAGATLQWTGGSSQNARLFAIGTASITIKQGTLNTTVSGTGGVTIRNVYVKGFHAKGGDGTNGGGGGLGAGGAIYLQNGTLVVENSTFENNGAVGGDGGSGTDIGGGGGGLSGNGGGAHYKGSGGGGGGARGNGGNAPGGGGGGGGTAFSGGNSSSDTGASGGYLCGGNGSDQSDNGNDGHSAPCPGGGGGGGGYDVNPINPDRSVNGGAGNYGGGGGGGPDNGGNGGFGGGGGGSSNGHNGGGGGFGGGGGDGFDSEGSGGPFGGRSGSSTGGGGGGLGGAIFNDGGALTVHNSTFYNNYVTRGVGGDQFAANGADAGGAIFSRDGTTAIVNCTIANNQGTGSGAGVVVYSDAVFSPFPALTLQNTIVANNGANECFYSGNVSRSGAGNLITSNGSGTGQFGTCPGLTSNVDPQLGPLQDNGGTPTMAIGIGSSAMGMADAATSFVYDQRYADRPQPDQSPRNGYDIGAYEVCRRFLGGRLVSAVCSAVNSPPPPATTLTMQVSPSGYGTTTPSPGDHDADLNSVAALQATPNFGYAFRRWTGNVADPTNPNTTVTMTQPQTVTANFAVLQIIGIARSGLSNVTITFKATHGVTYRLERTASLTSADWQPVSGVSDLTPATDGNAQITDTSSPIGLGRAFYRVHLLPN